MSKNKFRHESMKPEQFDNDDFTMKIFEYSKSIFQLMIVVNGSVVAALLLNISPYIEKQQVLYFQALYLVLYLNRYAQRRYLGMQDLIERIPFQWQQVCFLKPYQYFVYLYRCSTLFVFYPCKTHNNPKIIAEGNTDIKIENIQPWWSSAHFFIILLFSFFFFCELTFILALFQSKRISSRKNSSFFAFCKASSGESASTRHVWVPVYGIVTLQNGISASLLTTEPADKTHG